jgi:flagellar biosynthesis protein FlhB
MRNECATASRKLRAMKVGNLITVTELAMIVIAVFVVLAYFFGWG